ncbi:hypothetical protein JI435_424380, partial [Parastagonospora nodorum SN15]
HAVAVTDLSIHANMTISRAPPSRPHTFAFPAFHHYIYKSCGIVPQLYSEFYLRGGGVFIPSSHHSLPGVVVIFPLCPLCGTIFFSNMPILSFCLYTHT